MAELELMDDDKEARQFDANLIEVSGSPELSRIKLINVLISIADARRNHKSVQWLEVDVCQVPL